MAVEDDDDLTKDSNVMDKVVCTMEDHSCVLAVVRLISKKFKIEFDYLIFWIDLLVKFAVENQ